MGLTKSKAILLTNYELQDFADMTNLTFDQVETIYKLFRVISTLQKDDGVIDPQEFKQAFGHNQSETSDILFNQIDLNYDRVLNFREFIIGLSKFLQKNSNEQIKFLFHILDLDKNNEIYEANLIQVLGTLLKEFPTIKINEQLITELVKREFDLIFGCNSVLFTTSSENFQKSKKQQISQTPLIQVNQENIENQFDFQQDEEQKIEESFSPAKKMELEDNDQDNRGHVNKEKGRSLTFQMFYTLINQNEYILQWLKIDSDKLKEAVNNMK